MRVVVAGDHNGFAYKEPMLRALRADGHEVEDLGTHSEAPADYPDFAIAVGGAVRNGRADAGVLICGSGAGVAIAANKLRGVRAALAHDHFTARQSREDDDANVICLGAKVVGVDLAIELTREFLAARFSGAERHRRRLAKVMALERAELPCGHATGAHEEEAMTSAATDDALERLAAMNAGTRLWRQDASLWSTDPAVQAAVANRLGWLGAPATMRPQIAELQKFAAEVRADGIRDIVLLGMGGSSLAPEMLQASLGAAAGHPHLTVLDSTDPGAIRAVRGRIDPARTLFLVSSKSGTTTEMLTLYRYFRAELERAVPKPGPHFVAITDPGAPLQKLATEAGFRRTFLNDPRIGGRFSALSYFGLVPAALIGADVGRLLDRAEGMASRCGAAVGVHDNPGLHLGAALASHALAGRDKVTLLTSPPIRAFGAWLEQLLTESTGKQGKGLVVINDEPLGSPDVYGTDRVFVVSAVGRDAELDAAANTLEGAGHPVVRLALDDPYDVAAEFVRWEIATAAAGVLLGINPFDEPNVAQAKEATNAALARYLETGRLPEWPTESATDLVRVLSQARAGDYVALLAYLTPSDATTAALQQLRVALRDRTRLATTAGYGPRYLHSTGQLHKGGPPTPILVIFTTTHEDLPIPGERYGFATLEMAQALGDLATLRAAHRRVLWLPLDRAPHEALARIGTAVEAIQGKVS